MNDINYRKLNSTETILKAMPQIIEAFVSFYGEEEREYIQNKFKNMLVVGYCPPKNVEYLINKDMEQKSHSLIEEFQNKIKINVIPKEGLKKIIFNNSDLNYAYSHPILYYINYLNSVGGAFDKERTVNFLRQIYPEVNMNNLDEIIRTKAQEELREYVEEYINTLNEFKKYKESIRPYNDYVEKSRSLKESLEKKYTSKLIDLFKNLFTDSELEEINKILRSDNYDYYKLRKVTKKIENYFGNGLNSVPLIKAFSRENEELLKTGSDWRKNSIISDRINYFNNLGIHLGDNYDDYLNDPRVKEDTPSFELVAKILEIKSQIYTEMMNEYYQSIQEFQYNRKRIDSENLLDKNDGYDANTYENNGTKISINIKRTKEGYIEFPILYISMGAPAEGLDHCLIHELNHVYELHLQSVDNNSYSMTCGWDILSDSLSDDRTQITSLEARKEKRNYELMNEIVNELIAQEIHEILVQNGQFIFNTKDNVKIKGMTSYERTLFLIKNFYETYKKEIIESRRSGDMSLLFKKVGQENFEELNKLFHIFYENFQGMTFYNTIKELEENKETENTKKLKEIIIRRNEILAKMEEHSRTKKEAL